MKPYSVNSVSVSVNQEATAVLHLHAAAKPTTYQAIIDTAKALFAEGHSHLVVDLTYVPRLNLTTMFVLYSLALIANGQQPADAEGGWHALREMENKLAGQTVTNLNLCAPQRQVALALEYGGFTECVAVWPTLSMALKAFSPPAEERRINKKVTVHPPAGFSQSRLH